MEHIIWIVCMTDWNGKDIVQIGNVMDIGSLVFLFKSTKLRLTLLLGIPLIGSADKCSMPGSSFQLHFSGLIR